MGYGLSPVMRSSRAPVAAVGSPGAAGFWIRGVWGDAFDEAMAAYARLGKVHGGGRALSASREAARLAKLVADRLAPYAEHDGVDPLASGIAYPEDSDFGERLRYLAAMISKPLGIRVASRPTATSTPTTTSWSWAPCSPRSASAWPRSRPTSRRAASPTGC
jgi:hypothetical protein